MNWPKPSVAVVWEAIDAYLKCAYGAAPPPSAVRHRLETLRACPADNFYDCPVFELDDKGSPARLGLRLGNRVYPHMKMVIERSPNGNGHLFRADTHDRHIQPAPNSREARAFHELMRMNQQTAEAIEAEWSRRGVPTFKQFLREDLQRRSAQADQAPPV